jgi:hypothetical protein
VRTQAPAKGPQGDNRKIPKMIRRSSGFIAQLNPLVQRSLTDRLIVRAQHSQISMTTVRKALCEENAN